MTNFQAATSRYEKKIAAQSTAPASKHVYLGSAFSSEVAGERSSPTIFQLPISNEGVREGLTSAEREEEKSTMDGVGGRAEGEGRILSSIQRESVSVQPTVGTPTHRETESIHMSTVEASPAVQVRNKCV